LISDSSVINKQNDIEIAIKNNLTIVNFQECEDYLKKQGYIAQNQTISYSKTDWNSALKAIQNVNTTNSTSVSFSLYASNGTEIDKLLCSHINTEFLIPIIGFNDEMRSNLTKNGYDLTNPNSSYFYDMCIPMKANDTAVTIKDRESEFSTANLVCMQGCTYKSINLTIGYISCLCDTNGPDEVASEFGTIFLDVFIQSNIEIIKCWKTVLQYVNYLLTI